MAKKRSFTIFSDNTAMWAGLAEGSGLVPKKVREQAVKIAKREQKRVGGQAFTQIRVMEMHPVRGEVSAMVARSYEV